MELKRILARDTRSAMEQAIQVYGPDVLVISNHQVGAQTELVVAIEVPEEPQTLSTADASPLPAASSVAVAPAAAATSFRQTLDAASQVRPEPATDPVSSAPVAPALAMTTAEQDARDYLRSREIVELVRDEIAALRREFRIRQQSTAWQTQIHYAPAIAPLVQALQDAGIPGALRTLLLDSLSHCSDAQHGLQALREQLSHHLQRPSAALPLQGLHLLAGPSGAGKTLMTARLAQLGAQAGCDQVAIISYQDVRAGAWSQTQMLASQLGVDAFRASDAQNLRLLVNELANRRLVLIDTAGIQMADHMAQILAQAPNCQAHAVLPADASGATLQRVLGMGLPFQSLLLTKTDEASSPWPLLQILGDNDLVIAGASCGSRLSDLMQDFSTEQLVDLALAPLIIAAELPASPEAAPQAFACAPDRPIAVSTIGPAQPQPLPARQGGALTATLDAIAHPPNLPVFLSTAQALSKGAASGSEPAPIEVSGKPAAVKPVSKVSVKSKAMAKPIAALNNATGTPARQKSRVSPQAATEAALTRPKTSRRSKDPAPATRKKAVSAAAHP